MIAWIVFLGGFLTFWAGIVLTFWWSGIYMAPAARKARRRACRISGLSRRRPQSWLYCDTHQAHWQWTFGLTCPHEGERALSRYEWRNEHDEVRSARLDKASVVSVRLHP